MNMNLPYLRKLKLKFDSIDKEVMLNKKGVIESLAGLEEL